MLTGGTIKFRIVGLIGQNFPIRTSIYDENDQIVSFTAIASDSLDIVPVKQLNYIWVAAGERYDIEVTIPTRQDVKERYILFGRQTKEEYIKE